MGLSLPSRRIYKFPSENRKRNLPQDKESKLIHVGHGYVNVGNFSEDDVLLKGYSTPQNDFPKKDTLSPE